MAALRTKPIGVLQSGNTLGHPVLSRPRGQADVCLTRSETPQSLPSTLLETVGTRGTLLLHLEGHLTEAMNTLSVSSTY